MAAPKSNHGGRREGSGRKAPDGARVSLSCRIARKTYDSLREQAKADGLPLGRLIDKLVK